MIHATVLLALVWMALTGDWSLPAAAFALGVGWLLLRVTRFQEAQGFRRVRVSRLPGFMLVVARDVVVAGFDVAAAVLRPHARLRPAVVEVPLRLDRDAEIALLTLLISLTPGSLALDVSADRRTLAVHAMRAASPEALRREIQEGFERRILEVFR